MESTNHRDAAGRFVAGNPGSPGRPPRRKEEAMLNAIATVYTPEEVQDKLRKAMDLAEQQNSPRGMIAVASLIIEYVAGRPPQSLNVNRGQVDLWELLARDDSPLIPVDIEQQLLTGRDPVALPG